MTTNGVRATLNNLTSEQVFVTGFANAKQTALFIKANIAETSKVNIITHPTGDDDLALCEYISSILKGSDAITKEEVIKKVCNSGAQKFFDKNKPNFKPEDILLCTKELNSGFVMKVNKLSKYPRLRGLTMIESGLNLPDRTIKPRDCGLTILIDSGILLNLFRDTIYSSSDYIDFVKFGWGTSLITPLLELKIKVIQEHDINFFFGGTLFKNI